MRWARYGTAFNWFWFPLWREQKPLRESLSLLYRELADYCEAKYTSLAHPTYRSEKRCLPADTPAKAVDLITQCYQISAYAFGAQQ